MCALAAIFYVFVTLTTPTINELSIVSQRLLVLTRKKFHASCIKGGRTVSQSICTKEERNGPTQCPPRPLYSQVQSECPTLLVCTETPKDVTRSETDDFF